MTKATSIRTATLAALVVMLSLGLAAPASAADMPPDQFAPPVQVHGDRGTQFLPLGVGKSIVVDVPGEIKDVLVADPKIANAVVRTSRRAYIIGVAVGQTNIYFFDAAGRQILGYDIAVKRDLNGLRAALRRALPASQINVESLGADGIVLTGSAASQLEAQQAYDIAAKLVGDLTGTKVVNGLTVRGRDQVMIKVTVAEVQRNVIKQLGIDMNGTLQAGQAVVDFASINPFGINPPITTNLPPISPSTNGISVNYRGVNATLRAMEQAGVIRTLAEPTLTAISGESASFLVGGEFPVPKPSSSINQPPGIEFKQFGVSLNFTPVVLSEGRISLKVMTEVSELSNEGAVQIASISVPSLKTRRADTSVEIPSGGSLAMAGLIQDQTKQAINGFPGLMQVPVLGALFKSRDFVNRQTELMVLVTPYVVHPVARKDLSRPDDGYADASDPATSLLGRFNRLYGTPGRDIPQKKAYRGNVGFILD
jgi:pilus assembly protein CpaC